MLHKEPASSLTYGMRLDAHPGILLNLLDVTVTVAATHISIKVICTSDTYVRCSKQ